MQYSENGATRYSLAHRDDAPPPGGGAGAPSLRVNVFGRFEVLVDGVPIDSALLRQRRLKTLMGILALHRGQELHCDYIAASIWPASPAVKQRNSFYNLWYLLLRAVIPEGVDRSLYFAREQYSCRLLKDHVVTDVSEVERACGDLVRPGIDPVLAVDAYQRLQRAYQGDLLPGEDQNGIIVRSRAEWRERVAESLYGAAKALGAQGEAHTALWLVKAACRVDGMREDFTRLRMRLLIDLGRPAAALRVYTEMREYLMDEVGLAPSWQSDEMMREVIASAPGDMRIPVPGKRRRRRGPAPGPSRDVRTFPLQANIPL